MSAANGQSSPQTTAGIRAKRGHGEKISRLQCRAISALLTEPTILAAAAMAKISEKTLRRWLGEPAFRAAFDAAQQEIAEQVHLRLLASATKSAQVIDELQSDNGIPPAVRLAAARANLELRMKIAEICEHERRIAALESRSIPR